MVTKLATVTHGFFKDDAEIEEKNRKNESWRFVSSAHIHGTMNVYLPIHEWLIFMVFMQVNPGIPTTIKTMGVNITTIAEP